MSGAILGWGIDLGRYDSVAAKLFDDPECLGGSNGWSFYCYDEKHEGLALLLERSVVTTDENQGDHSVQIQVTLGSNGFPVLSSQPTPEEIDDLVEIINGVRPDKDTVELSMDLLLLPAD